MASPTMSRGAHKTVCRKCTRTVHIVEIDGQRLELDPELVGVVEFEARTPKRILARRVHADLCLSYQSAAARLKADALARRRP